MNTKILSITLLIGLLWVKPSTLFCQSGATNYSIAETNNKFACDLYQQLSKEKKNLFFSPLSISSALAMTFVGAKNATEAEMIKALHFSSDKMAVNKAYFEYAEIIKKLKDKKVEINLANAIWAQGGMRLLPDFVATLSAFYGSEVQFTDFKNDFEGSRQKINKWVEDVTKKKIVNLIPKGVLNELTRMVLVNAIYFNAAWENPFEKSRTTKAPFFITSKNKVNTDFMFASFRMRYVQMDGMQAVEIPYKGYTMSMGVVLPDKIDGIKDLEGKLSYANLIKWMSAMNYEKVELSLPKFKTISDFELNAVLQKLGMIEAFGMEADFSGITGDKSLFINKIIHKAFVDVNEEGTEAAASTAVVMAEKSAGPSKSIVFNANHPFVFYIKDNQKDVILFMGRLLNPTK